LASLGLATIFASLVLAYFQIDPTFSLIAGIWIVVVAVLMIIAGSDSELSEKTRIHTRLMRRWISWIYYWWIFWIGLSIILNRFFGGDILDRVMGNQSALGQTLTVLTVFFGFTGVIITYRLQRWESLGHWRQNTIRSSTGSEKEAEQSSWLFDFYNKTYYLIFVRYVVLPFSASVILLTALAYISTINTSEALVILEPLNTILEYTPSLIIGSLTLFFIVLLRLE